MVKSDRMAYSDRSHMSVQVFTVGRERSGLLNKVSKECCLVSQVVSNSFATPWTVAHQAPLSMGFSRQVTISSSRRSSRPRDWTLASCISGQNLYHWASREDVKGLMGVGDKNKTSSDTTSFTEILLKQSWLLLRLCTVGRSQQSFIPTMLRWLKVAAVRETTDTVASVHQICGNFTVDSWSFAGKFSLAPLFLPDL